MQGLVTDVCLKRKVRDYVALRHGGAEGMDIYVQHMGILNNQHQRAYDAIPLKSRGTKQPREDVERARQWMCKTFYDIRAFGAVMTTGVNCGQVRGPIQLTFARSITPVVPLDVSITRVAVTRAADTEITDEGEGGKQTEMGRKSLLPYGLFRGHGFVSPSAAKDTGLSSNDLELFWRALVDMWEIDRSAARGYMACRGLYVFSHEDSMGNAPSHKLFDLITVGLKEGVTAPRSIADYVVSVDDASLPAEVTLTRVDA
jgi:CRISPR-associated protein Csd2